MKNQHFFWVSYSDLMTTLFFIMLVLFAVCYSDVKKTENDKKVYEEAVEIKKQNEKIKEELDNKQKELDEINKNIQSLQEELNKRQTVLDEKDNDIQNLQSELDKKQKDLQTEQERVKTEQENVRIEKSKLKRITDLTNSVKDLPANLFNYNDKYKKHILNIEVRFDPGSDKLADLSDFKNSLLQSGRAIKKLIDSKYKEYGTPFLIVIEGQASKGGWAERVSPIESIKKNEDLSYSRARSVVNFWEQNGINLRTDDYNEKCELIIAGSGEKGVMRETDDIRNQRFLIHILPKPGKLLEE